MEGWTEAGITVESDVAEAEIITYQMCPYSTVEGDGMQPLDFGENIFLVTCIPEIGDSKEYTITITRELSDNALLSGLSLDAVPMDGFNPNIFAYTGISFPYEKETVELTATPQDSNAIVSGAGTLTLDEGDNLIIINVLAQDEATNQQYIVAINRAEAPASSSPSSSPTPVPSTTPTPTPVPTTGSTAPSPTPTTSPSTTTESTPTPTPSSEPGPSPTPGSSDEPTATPLTSTAPTNTPVPSPSGEPLETDNPDMDNDENGGFGNWIKEHPGITAASGVVIGGALILIIQQTALS